VYCYVLLPRISTNAGDLAADNSWLKGAVNTYSGEGLEQGVDWDVKQSVVGDSNGGGENTYSAPIVNRRRWKIVKKKRLTFVPGIMMRSFSFKWNWSTKDMIRGFSPCTEHNQYWYNRRVPRVFFVADHSLCQTGQGDQQPSLSYQFTQYGKVYLREHPETSTSGGVDPPGDQPIENMVGVAPVPAGNNAGDP